MNSTECEYTTSLPSRKFVVWQEDDTTYFRQYATDDRMRINNISLIGDLVQLHYVDEKVHRLLIKRHSYKHGLIQALGLQRELPPETKQPVFTRQCFNLTTRWFEHIPCCFSLATEMHLGRERFYIFCEGDFYAFDGVAGANKEQMEQRARAIQQLGYPCEVYQYPGGSHPDNCIYTLKMSAGSLKQEAPQDFFHLV